LIDIIVKLVHEMHMGTYHSLCLSRFVCWMISMVCGHPFDL
jgi:hypothetical protein